MRNLLHILLVFSLLGTAAAQAKEIENPEDLGCVQICPKLCVTVEQATTSKFNCMPPTNQGQCAIHFAQCQRTEDTCAWSSTPSYEACLAKAHD